jgi:hypothetical protein
MPGRSEHVGDEAKRLPSNLPANATQPEPWASSPAQMAYMAWLCLPKKDRTPKTEGNMALGLGVDRSTLYRWREQPGYMREVRRRVRENLGERYAEVLHTIEDLAVSGSVPHTRLYLELLGETPAGGDAEVAAGPGIKVLVGVDLNLIGNATVATPRVTHE